MNVAQWLNAIDLGQYEAVFREHEIDAGVLRDLVEADLEKIGVPLGHRKRLLKAIAALGTGETAVKPPGPAPASSPATAERRPITVMFCDLVGSTSMAAKLDAEDWRTLVNTYLDEASAAVTGLGGHVLKKLGDGLMALFGYPHAQENDAERAVRAALAIQRALGELNVRNVGRDTPLLAARIGLESGQVGGRERRSVRRRPQCGRARTVSRGTGRDRRHRRRPTPDRRVVCCRGPRRARA
jgi:hypothetical protein